jgi:polyphosphate kinase 2 (PPK2 family)
MTVNDKHIPEYKPSPSRNTWKPEPHDPRVDLVKRQQSPVFYGTDCSGMTARIYVSLAPRAVVRTNSRRLARLSVIKDLFIHLEYNGRDCRLSRTNPDSVFAAPEPVSRTA